MAAEEEEEKGAESEQKGNAGDCAADYGAGRGGFWC